MRFLGVERGLSHAVKKGVRPKFNVKKEKTPQSHGLFVGLEENLTCAFTLTHLET